MLHRPQAWLVRYGIAIITFGIATALALILEPVLEQSHIILFLAAVIASAWLGGVGPGLLATLLGVLLSGLIESGPSNPLGADDAVRLALFAIVAAGISALLASRPPARDRAAQSDDQLRLMLDGIADGVTVMAPDGRLIFANPAAAELVGFATPEEMLKAPLAEIMQRFEVRDEMGQPVPIGEMPQRLALQGQTPPARTVCWRIRETGEEHWSILESKPVLDEHGKVRFAVNIFRDITDIKRSERALRDEHERLSVTLSSIGDAVIAAGTGGVVSFMNPIAEQLIGWTEAEAKDLPLGEVFRLLDARTGAPPPDPLHEVLAKGDIVALHNHTLLIRRDGTQITIDVSGAPIRSADGKVTGAIFVFRDVTERKQAERALRESEVRFRTAFEQAAVGIGHATLEGRWLRLNQKFCDILGYTPEEMRAMGGFRAITHPDDVAEDERLVAGLLAGEESSYRREKRYLRKDGSLVWAIAHIALVRDEQGQPDYFVGVIEDITERKQMEAALRESEERFRTMANSVPVMIWVTDEHGEDTFVNEQWVDFAGRRPEELLGSGWLETIHPDDRARVAAEWEACQQECRAIRIEYRVRRHDGEYRWMLSTGVPVFAPGGAFIGYMGGMIDIQDRREAEAALRDSEERFRTMANSAPVMIWMSGEDGETSFVNDSWLEFTGVTLDQALDTIWWDLIHPDDWAEIRVETLSKVEQRQPFELEYRLRNRDGEYGWVVDRGVPRFDAGGQFLGYIGAVADITERRRAEAAQRFLSEASVLLAASLDYETTLASVASLAVSHIADWVAVDVLENGQIERVAVAHNDPEKVELARRLRDQYPPDPNSPTGVPAVLRTGRSQVFFEIPDSAVEAIQPAEYQDIIRKLSLKSAMIVPLTVRGHTLGAITFVLAESGQRFTTMDLSVAEELAARAAMAVDNARLYRNMGDQREHLRVTLASIGDAVIATDTQGRITFMNPVAESLTGWSEPDALGQHIADVFHIINEATRERVDNPIDRVLESGKAVGLANHTVLLARDGREVPIDDSGAPIRTQEGAISGVILVFRDISQRRRTESELAARARQQAAVAELGQLALRGTDLQTLMDEATRLVAATLDNDFAKVLELLPGGQEMLLRAGVGWQEGLVGKLKVSADPATSQAGYTLLQGGPVIVEDLRIDPRFNGPPTLTEHGVVSGVSTIIPGPVDVYGVIGTHTRTQRLFTQDDVNFLQAVANVLGEAIERQRVQQEVEERARQQAAVAGLGQRALGEVDLDTLMDEATLLVCETLHLEYCKVLELLPGGQELLLRAGYGWKEGLVGVRKVGTQRGSHGGYTLMSSHPVIFDDLPSETRFEESLLTEHNVISGLSVVIGGPDRPFGTLGAHSTERRRFTEDDINFLQAVANVLAEAIEGHRTDALLRQSLDRTRDLYEVSRHIGLANTPREVLEALVNSRTVANASQASIAIFDKPWDDTPPAYGEATVIWRRGEDVQDQAGRRFSFEDYAFANVMRRDEPLILMDAQADPRINETSRQYLEQMSTRSLILFPLVAGGDWFGHLTIHWEEAWLANESDARHMKGLVDQAAAAIYNFRLLQAEAAARQSAERADALKMKFLAMISHELRTPLTSIKGFATSLLAEDVQWDAASQHEFITIINEEANKLGNLIEQLLDLSRLEAGTLGIRREHISLRDILATTLPPLHIIAGEHPLEVEMPPDVPELLVDPTRIAQVLSNIVNNAANYSPHGSEIRLAITCERGMVRFDVTDEGPGIPPEERHTVFEAFRQATNRPTREIKGAGLGLAISRGLVEAHGGHIWIADRPGPGTTVSFTLPVAGEE